MAGLNRTPDLSSLNETERTVLGMLAEGHTAKSIAAATGRSEPSVNERLREARRKTGVGSSRELARLWAQENRDKLIGMAPEHGGAPTGGPEAAVPIAGGRSAKGYAVMALIALAAAVVAAVTLSPQTVPETTFSDVPSPAGAHARVVAEARDPAWAPAAEAALRTRYARVPEVAASLKVRCATTICEITAAIVPAVGDDLNKATLRLQTPEITGDIDSPALKNLMTGFTQGPKPFFAFWTREKR
jgi:DNA-binding CsgD family transcriptional regulator